MLATKSERSISSTVSVTGCSGRTGIELLLMGCSGYGVDNATPLQSGYGLAALERREREDFVGLRERRRPGCPRQFLVAEEEGVALRLQLGPLGVDVVTDCGVEDGVTGVVRDDQLHVVTSFRIGVRKWLKVRRLRGSPP